MWANLMEQFVQEVQLSNTHPLLEGLCACLYQPFRQGENAVVPAAACGLLLFA